MIEERLPFGGGREQLEKILGAICRSTGGFCRRFGDDEYILRTGSLLSLNPNTARMTASIRREAQSVAISLRFFTLPWTEGKLQRIARFRMLQFRELFRLLAKEVEPPRHIVLPFSFIRTNNLFSGIASAAVWSLWSSVLGFLFGLFSTWLAGVTLMSGVIGNLAVRSQAIEAKGAIPLPGLHELHSISPLSCSVVFALPVAFFIALGITLFLVLSEGIVAASRLTFPVLLFFVVILGMALYPIMNPFWCVGFSLLVPISVYLGYSIVWGRKGEVRNEPSPRAVRMRSLLLAIGIPILTVVATAVATLPRDNDVPSSLAVVRDRALLSSSVGTAISDFYYRHTLYPKELIAPSAENSPFSKDLAEIVWLGAASIALVLPALLILCALAAVALLVLAFYRKLPRTIAHIASSAIIALIVASALFLIIPSEKGRLTAEIRGLTKDDDKMVEKFIAYLRDGDADIRYEAAYRIYQLPYTNVAYVSSLTAALDDPDARVRMWAVIDLGVIGDRGSHETILRKLDDTDLLVRRRAADALVNYPSLRTLGALTEKMKSDRWYVAVRCRETLMVIERKMKK